MARTPFIRWLASRVMTPLLHASVATLLVASWQSIGVESGINRLERDAYAWHLMQRPTGITHPGIVIVAVDDQKYEDQEAPILRPRGSKGKDLETYRLPGCECVAPRLSYAKAIDRLIAWGARGVVLDLFFRYRCDAYPQPGSPSEDETLAKSMRRAGNVVVAASPEVLPLDRRRDPTTTTDLILHQPTEPIGSAAFDIGSPRVDPRDREYAVELQQTAIDGRKGGLLTSYALPLLAWDLYERRGAASDLEDPLELGLRLFGPSLAEGAEPRLFGDFFTRGFVGSAVRPEESTPGAVIEIHKGSPQMDEAFFRKRLLINFSSGSAPDEGRYHPVRLSWVLDMPRAEGKGLFSDRLVIIGNPAIDQHSSAVGMMPGNEILAHAIATMIRRDPIRPVQPLFVLAVAFCGAVVAAAVIRCSSPLWAGLTVVLLLAAIQAGCAALLQTSNAWLMPITPSVVILFTAAGTGAWETNRVRGLVARLLPRHISRVMERAGGFQVENGTVLFSDIRGYTSFSESLDPAVVMENLNLYFTSVHRILERYGGHFVKSPGDCVVAWFADDRRAMHHTERAMRVGLELLDNVERFRDRWEAAGMHPFSVGVGINTGPMAVGILDAHRHIEPTLIGDSVNLAARIESLKIPNAPLLVAGATLAPSRDRFIAEHIGEVTISGRVQPVDVYRIVGLAGEKPSGPSKRDSSVRSQGAT